MYLFDSLQVIVAIVYEALTVLAEVDHSEPVGDDVVHADQVSLDHNRNIFLVS